MPCRDTSNKYQHHICLWRTGENYPRIIIKHSPLKGLFFGLMFALINSQFLPLKNLKLEKEAIDDIHLRLNSAANHVVIV